MQHQKCTLLLCWNTENIYRITKSSTTHQQFGHRIHTRNIPVVLSPLIQNKLPIFLLVVLEWAFLKIFLKWKKWLNISCSGCCDEPCNLKKVANTQILKFIKVHIQDMILSTDRQTDRRTDTQAYTKIISPSNVYTLPFKFIEHIWLNEFYAGIENCALLPFQNSLGKISAWYTWKDLVVWEGTMRSSGLTFKIQPRIKALLQICSYKPIHICISFNSIYGSYQLFTDNSDWNVICQLLPTWKLSEIVS